MYGGAWSPNEGTGVIRRGFRNIVQTPMLFYVFVELYEQEETVDRAATVREEGLKRLLKTGESRAVTVKEQS